MYINLSLSLSLYMHTDTEVVDTRWKLFIFAFQQTFGGDVSADYVEICWDEWNIKSDCSMCTLALQND